jgi:D-3-phosphoglycerate dehydrogenase / 2-oxoglutarate reductase
MPDLEGERPATRARVLTQVALFPQALTALEPLAEVIVGTVADTDEWYAQAQMYDAMILAGTTVMNGPRLDRIGPRLRALARPGIGVDMIDLAASTARGILVVNTPDGPTESTAEHAVALMLSLTKRVAASDRILRSGQGFPRYGSFTPGLEALGATLGLVGLGRIGGRVAEIARVLGMRVIAHDPFVTAARAAALGVELAPTLRDVLAAADVVSVHCPSIPETHHLINAETLAQMRPGSFLVNVSRGAIVDEGALVAALRSGHLAGAGLDVYDPEPPAADHPLFSLPNTICTTHIGSYTSAGLMRMQVQVCEQVAMLLRGERPANLVNAEVWGKHRK